MVKYLAIGLMLLGSGCGSEISNSLVEPNSQVVIDAVNEATLPIGQWNACIEDINTQLNRDVKPVWHFNAVLRVRDRITEGRPTLVIRDHLTGNYNDTPLDSLQGIHIGWTAQVNYSQALARGTWQVTASHEVLEMLSERSGGPEICDPVAPYGYSLTNGAKTVSDFVFPSYYGGPPPYDFLNLVKTPNQPAPGGVK